MSLGLRLNWFVHEKLQHSLVASTRARLLAGCSLAFGPLMMANAPRGLASGDYFIASVIGLCGLVMFLTAFVLKKTGSLGFSSNVFICAYAIMLTLASYGNGGELAQTMYNFAILLTVSYLFYGIKNGMFWTAYAIFLAFVFKIMRANGHQFPPVDSTDDFTNLVVLLFMLSILGFLYESSSSKNLNNFAKEKAETDQMAEKLNHLFTDVDIVMTGVAKGDLSQRIIAETDHNLESLKSSINTALDMLSDTVSKVMTAAHEINSGTSQVSSAAQSLASGATEQAASLEEVSSSMDEIGARAKTNSENAHQAQALSKQASEDIDRGNAQMEAMQASMNKINDTSSNVSKVIKVIDEIAFQTNLLALNAAVEAARAGKYGKGFAVVAEEVRNLASRSAEAAKDTTELIENSILEVENGVRNANQTAEILHGFIENISKVTDIVGEISAASQEQAAGAIEINTSLDQVNEVVQQNSSISEETASSSEELSSQAALLMDLINQFKLGASSKKAVVKTSQPQEVSKPLPKKESPKALPPKEDQKPETRKKIVLDDDDFGKY